ncbi:tyrosine phosphatase [Colletotrichum truncatum]|uniref:Tyrosine phosphatase n=1 Tax=Colletotrichum truncatum TaxID=5467 RepID=A0ACC3ZF87_COLTU|nr:tyrosine phosphatase [Colletotrichum truncatum]KAF6801590.1 tyrosine phosphatase [Colletotrichum truncatum]
MASHTDPSVSRLLTLSNTDVQLAVPEDDIAPILSSPPFVQISGLFNTRDLGLVPGSRIRPGLAFRSGSLEGIDEKGRQALFYTLGIKSIFDLRSPGEREKCPEPHIPGIESVWVPNAYNNTIDIRDFVEGGGERGYCKMYMDMMEVYAPTMKVVLQHVRDRPGEPFLFHCALGRDRTGILAGLLMSLAGADEQTVTLDYMLTRIGSEPVREILLERAKHDNNCESGLDVPAFYNLCSLRVSTWELFVSEVKAKYGGFEKYVTCRLEIAEDDLDQIKKNLRA